MNANQPATVRAPKTLAAIVFTDVVGFSRHTNIDEARALASFQRDLAIIREVCDRHHGVVLKTLGDGALMRFNSADNALSCAIEVQRIFHEQSQRLDHSDVLTHRIGVHLGDIMTTASDVFGDGVNVAARLQAEAKPGSIAMSRTVYDVVKGKVDFDATYIGPRQLKGIKDAVTIWEIPSISSQIMGRRNAALEGMLGDDPANASPSNPGFKGTAAVLIVVGSVLLVVVATFLVIHAMQRGKAQGDREWATRLARSRELAASRKAAEPNNATTVADVDPFSDSALVAGLAPLFAKDDFAGMATLITNKAGTGALATDAAKRYTSLAGYMDWLDSRLDQTSEQSPLSIAVDPDTGGPSQFFRDSAGHLVRRTETTPAFVELEDLSKASLEALGEAAQQLLHANDEVSKDEINQDIQILRDEAARFGDQHAQ